MKQNSVLILYAMALIYGLTFWGAPAFDPDLGWHLLGGAWIASHHSVPSADFINSLNQSWHDYHWLAQVLMYGIFTLGGYAALRVALGLLMAYLAKVLIDILLILSRGKPRYGSIVLSFLFCMALLGHIGSVRPQMISLCLLALALRRLLQPPKNFEIPYLCALTVLMVNVHIYWIFVPILWFVYRGIEVVPRSMKTSARYAVGGLLALALCGLLSPYGIVPYGQAQSYPLRNYALLWDYFMMPSKLRSSIGEMVGSLAAEGMAPYLLVLFIAVVARAFSVKGALARRADYVMALSSWVLTLRSLKFISIFAIVGLPVFVRANQAVFRSLRKRLAFNDNIFGKLLVAGVTLYALVVGTLHSPWLDDQNEIMSSYLPIEACRKLAHMDVPHSPDRDHVRVLTHFNYGGWCRWMIYQENPALDFRVTTDGRTQWVPPEHYEESFDLYNLKNNWYTTLKEWDPDVALIPKDRPLGQLMSRLPEYFRLVYQDGNFALFVPVKRLR